MKKILAIAAMAAALLFTGCKKTSNFNKYLVPDYEYVQAQYEGQQVVFYEAQIILNGSPAELGRKAKPVSVKEVFQVVDSALVVFVNRDYANGTFEVEEHQGYWCEDVVVDPYTVGDYNYALEALLNVKGVIEIPDAVFVTLRNPLGPTPYENPFYIFGSNHTSFIAVDAVTFEVQSFNASESVLKETVEELEEELVEE